MDSKKDSLLNTLLYSSLFSSALTEKELYRYLISSTYLTPGEFKNLLERNSAFLTKDGKYYALASQPGLIKKRKKNSQYSEKKEKIALEAARFLSWIPTIYFIGISGSVASGNAEENDDIDFFILTKKNTLYISRILALLSLQMIKKRRIYGDKNVKDKICLNMWLDSEAFTFPMLQRDIYTAHEIAQIQPLLERAETYQTFLEANLWCKKYLPHIFSSLPKPKLSFKRELIYEIILQMLEPFARQLQYYFIFKHHTTETVSAHYAAFHPNDYRVATLKKFSRLLRDKKNN